jgi:hypothetical protein
MREMTGEQLQAERDAWYQAGLHNGRLRAYRQMSDDLNIRRMVWGDVTVPVRLVEDTA